MKLLLEIMMAGTVTAIIVSLVVLIIKIQRNERDRSSK